MSNGIEKLEEVRQYIQDNHSEMPYWLYSNLTDIVDKTSEVLEAELKAKDERIETQKQAISFLESRIGNRSCENCNPARMGVENRDCQNCFWHPDSGLYDHFIPNGSGYTPIATNKEPCLPPKEK